jgi:hypothetical protein
MAQVPEMSFWVRAGMMVFVLLLVAVMVAYHSWLDRLIGKREDRHVPARERAPVAATRRAD